MPEKQLPPPLRIFQWLVFPFTLLSLATAVITSALHRWPGFAALFPPVACFDFWVFADRMHHLHSPKFFTFPGPLYPYPAPVALLYDFFYQFSSKGYLVYAAAALAGSLFALRKLHQRITNRPAATLTCAAIFLTSWPLYLALERGNMEAILWLLFAASIWALYCDRVMLSAVLLGLTAAFKLYPILCIALFLRKKQWKQIVVALATMALTTALALRFIEPNILVAQHIIARNVRLFVQLYVVVDWRENALWEHSYFGLLKIVTLPLHLDPNLLVKLWSPAIALVMLLLFFGRVRHLSRDRQLLFLVTACITIPPVSYDYTLLNLYIPFAVVLVRISEGRWRGGTALMALFAVIFAPATFLAWRHIVFAGALKGIALLLVMILALDPFHRLPTARSTEA